MFAREIRTEEIRFVIENGEAIEQYPEDRPYPSHLLLGMVQGRPIHVVLAYDPESQIGYVVTTYIPDPELWSDDFRSRRDR